MALLTVASETPGTVRSRSSTDVRNCTRLSTVGYRCSDNGTRSVRIRSAGRPKSSRVNRINPRIIMAAATTSTTDSETSATTSRPRVRA